MAVFHIEFSDRETIVDRMQAMADELDITVEQLIKRFICDGMRDENDNTPSISEIESILDGGFRIIPWGHWKWPFIVSTPERAYLELLDELPGHDTFHMADVIMEGLTNLSPRRMQYLLENTRNIKVKRLFFFFAERHGYQWLNRMNRENIDLGHGKRMLVKGGKLDAKYQITVPTEFAMETGRRAEQINQY